MQSQTASPRKQSGVNRKDRENTNGTTTDSPREQKERLLFHFIGMASALFIVLGLFEAVYSRTYHSASDFALAATLLAARFIGKSGRSEAAVDITFWGSIVILALTWVFRTAPGDISQDTSAILIASASTMSVILMGVYAVRRYQVDVMFAIAVVANVLWIVFYDYDVAEWIHLVVAYSAVLVLCYLAARLALRTSRQVEKDYKAIHRLNNELENSHFAQSRVHAALADCVSKFSHDVRSPLTASLIVIDKLQEANDPEQQKSFVAILRRSQEAILSLVQFGLDACKPAAAVFDETRTVYLGRFLAGIAELHQTSTTASGPRIEILVPESSPAIDVPLTGLTRIMDNLVQNALKYTPSGTIVLSATLEQTNSDGKRFDLAISVRDSGKGMSAERLEEVRKGTNGPDSEVPSSRGIGLASCRSVITAYHGSLSIDSRLGEGTAVTITIPVRCPIIGEAKSASEPDVSR